MILPFHINKPLTVAGWWMETSHAVRSFPSHEWAKSYGFRPVQSALSACAEKTATPALKYGICFGVTLATGSTNPSLMLAAHRLSLLFCWCTRTPLPSPLKRGFLFQAKWNWAVRATEVLHYQSLSARQAGHHVILAVILLAAFHGAVTKQQMPINFSQLPITSLSPNPLHLSNSQPVLKFLQVPTSPVIATLQSPVPLASVPRCGPQKHLPPTAQHTQKGWP